MPVKARPQAALILIPTQLPLGFFMEWLHGMATMGILDQFLQRRRGGQITPVELALVGLSPSRPLPQQPADVRRPLCGKTPRPQRHKLLAQPAFGPVTPAEGAPLAPRHGGQRRVGSLTGRRAASLHPHLNITPNGHSIPLVARFQCRQDIKTFGLSPSSASAVTPRCGTPQARA